MLVTIGQGPAEASTPEAASCPFLVFCVQGWPLQHLPHTAASKGLVKQNQIHNPNKIPMSSARAPGSDSTAWRLDQLQ